jgi:anthranilate synthase/aminodeoxychorismate synthase-like glutamine amidotransferase
LKVLLIDFYDSFTFLIAHYLESCGAEVEVVEDKKIVLAEIEHFDAIVFSPGPGLPKETHSMFKVLEQYAGKKKILGICLGMQGIAEFYGNELYNQVQVKHGVSEKINIFNSTTLFKQLPKSFQVGLYHSWAVTLNTASEMKQIALSENNVIMAIQHVSKPIYGVQFHPESILTENGKEIFKNFLFL